MEQNENINATLSLYIQKQDAFTTELIRKLMNAEVQVHLMQDAFNSAKLANDQYVIALQQLQGQLDVANEKNEALQKELDKALTDAAKINPMDHELSIVRKSAKDWQTEAARKDHEIAKLQSMLAAAGPAKKTSKKKQKVDVDDF